MAEWSTVIQAMAALFSPHTIAMPTVRVTSYSARFAAWGAAIAAMQRAQSAPSRRAWLDASAAWLAMADLHDEAPRDQKIYRGLAIDCRRRADKLPKEPKR
jgi:hypothetical protein